MGKLFNWIGSLIAIACLMEIASNPKQVLRDIQGGPMPHLAAFNDSLNQPTRKNSPKQNRGYHRKSREF